MSLISAQFYNMPGRYERVSVGWHCAKIKGHAELKIQSKDLYLVIRFVRSASFSLPQQMALSIGVKFTSGLILPPLWLTLTERL